MAKVIPFKAIRPTRDKVSLVASRSYQTYTRYERDSRMAYNPFSFLHIVNPGYKYARKIKGQERYEMVKNRYQEFKEEGILVQDEQPAYYVYKIVNRERQEFNGIIAAVSTDDYKNNVIKKHEDTMEFRERIFTDYLKTVGFNAEPVLLMYPDSAPLATIIKSAQQTRAEFEFTTTYRDTHFLWLVHDSVQIEKIKQIFEEMPVIYIADGHHRSASSCLLADELKAENEDHTGQEGYNFFMSYLIPESDLRIYEFNRLVKDLNGLTKEEFLIELDQLYRIQNRGETPYKPSKKHHFVMYLDGEYYSLYLRKPRYEINSALDDLDTHLLHETILRPILGIDEPRKDKRLVYSHYDKGFVNVKTQVDKGTYAVGFGMVPTSVEDLKAVADQGLTMPPKSTFIVPKMRSGVTIYEF